MPKRSLKPSTQLCPVPVVLVTCRDSGGRPNIVTVAWTGVICSDPPMVSVSIRPSRYSHGIIKQTGQFVVNVPSADMVRKVDMCGIVSGRDQDKFAYAGLTQSPAEKVSPPLILECPLNMECRVTEIIPLGVHDMFLGEILAVHASEDVLDAKGQIAIEKANPLAYCPPDHSYRAVGDALGTYGYSKKG